MKGITFVIFILILLCAGTFGAYYLKIHPEMVLSQKIFKTTPVNEQQLTEEDMDSLNSPFTDKITVTPTDSTVVQNPTDITVPPINTGNGAVVVAQGDPNETVFPNNTDPKVITKPPTTPTQPTNPDPKPIIKVSVTQTLKKGSKGAEVKLVQQYLIDNQYLTGKADGVFGTMTESAIKKFQVEYKLTTDGIVSGKTMDTLNELLAA